MPFRPPGEVDVRVTGVHIMKSILLATIAILSFGLIGTQQASAAWQDEIFGTGTNRLSAYNRAEKAERPARAERPVRTARASTNDDETPAPRGRRAARSTNNDNVGGGSSLGGGLASYYWQPQRVASGGWFNPNAMTAAHKTLPFGTRVRVTNANNGQSVDVTINDRGPYIAGRVIDLSSAAAGAINMKGSGVVPVRMTVLGR